MRNTLLGLFVAIAPVYAQAPPAAEAVPVVTVCEAIADLPRYHGKMIAQVGRSSGTSEGNWLVEDRCERNLVTDGYKWDNLVALTYAPPQSPEAPVGTFSVDELALQAKLSLVRKTTPTRMEPANVIEFAPAGSGLPHKYSVKVVKSQWGVYVGPFETRETLRRAGVRGRKSGFGHLNGAPAQLVYSPNHPPRFIRDTGPPPKP